MTDQPPSSGERVAQVIAELHTVTMQFGKIPSVGRRIDQGIALLRHLQEERETLTQELERLARINTENAKRVLDRDDKVARLEAALAEMRTYARHKASCPLSTDARMAHINHVENHDSDEMKDCEFSHCLAWADGAVPDCTCGLDALAAEPRPEQRSDLVTGPDPRD